MGGREAGRQTGRQVDRAGGRGGEGHVKQPFNSAKLYSSSVDTAILVFIELRMSDSTSRPTDAYAEFSTAVEYPV